MQVCWLGQFGRCDSQFGFFKALRQGKEGRPFLRRSSASTATFSNFYNPEDASVFRRRKPTSCPTDMFFSVKTQKDCSFKYCALHRIFCHKLVNIYIFSIIGHILSYVQRNKMLLFSFFCLLFLVLFREIPENEHRQFPHEAVKLEGGRKMNPHLEFLQWMSRRRKRKRRAGSFQEEVLVSSDGLLV